MDVDMTPTIRCPTDPITAVIYCRSGRLTYLVTTRTPFHNLAGDILAMIVVYACVFRTIVTGYFGKA